MELELFVNMMMGGIVLLMVLLAWWGLTAASDEAKAKAKADDDFEAILKRGVESGAVKYIGKSHE